jgi:hypothetical protein
MNRVGLMRSNQTSNFGTQHGGTPLATRGAVQAVRIGSNLIAFYPQAIHEPQPYVILFDPASGILKRLDLRAGK